MTKQGEEKTMGVEIERKFLVRSDEWRASARSSRTLVQGYLHADAGRQVRVRLAEDTAYLTVKGPRSGLARAEFEYPIPYADALAMLELAGGATIVKRRYDIAVEGPGDWVVDVYQGAHAGLVVAEVEWQADAAEEPVPPPWVGADVTGDSTYANTCLARARARATSSPDGARPPVSPVCAGDFPARAVEIPGISHVLNIDPPLPAHMR
ncbi:CYTH domain-containing protein (plasmid) [Streptomyces sp. HUAS TT11]|uniref:CYTH domain-containing protein n=1 Tax=Streptomyces sp. HUAS TT11 TaxID=3447508 RepID=UPI003F654B14